MIRVKFIPDNKIVDLEEDETLLACAYKAGVYVHTVCGGKASCAECKVKITDGNEYLQKSQFEEKRLLGNVFHITKERLSCQCRGIEEDVKDPENVKLIVVDTSGHKPLSQDEVRDRKNAKYKKRFIT